MKMLFGSAESLCSYDTLQFDDYDKVLATRFDAKEKAERRRTVFPEDCRKALELGVRLSTPGA